ncbi:Uncharacterized protein APZ42_016935 [Daphnia magna]|uniref:Uncharacterized protein n=1 Tax=Daphnia magna TaxID=35525 RepID=A0A165A8X4_9CRUS|nr:Uncharacterized protein APZ42_016935 [Daphnia magna]
MGVTCRVWETTRKIKINRIFKKSAWIRRMTFFPKSLSSLKSTSTREWQKI